MDSQVKLPGRTPSELCKLGQATEPLWIFIFFIWNRDPLPTVMGLDWGMQTGDSWPADPCYDLIFLLAQIYIFRNMNWMPLDGMSVLTNDFFFYVQLPYLCWWVIIWVSDPRVYHGVYTLLSPCLVAGSWLLSVMCVVGVLVRGWHKPTGLLLSVASRGAERPMDLVSESSWLSFEVSWSQIIHPLHPGFNSHTTWGPIWNINQDYRIPMKTGDS